ncbi:MAG: SCO1664 family protein [Herpetosiphon sp.]
MDKEQPQPVSMDRVLKVLSEAELTLAGLMPDSSNYTFLTELEADDLSILAIYKPRRGERPLWDFPQGTLCQREAAAFVVSSAIGWHIVPPTVLRDAAPHGVGSVQLYISNDAEAHYFALRNREEYAATFKRIAVFDNIINNADRKGGHILLGDDGRIWGIDHGIAFHAENKLRTVIWEFAGEPLPDDILADLTKLQTTLAEPDNQILSVLNELLSHQEVTTFIRRLDRQIRRPIFPRPGGNRSVPWPPI